MRRFDPWEVRAPAAMIGDALSRANATEGDVLVVLLPIADVQAQDVLDVVTVHEADLPDRFEASELLREHAGRLVEPRAWTGDRWAPPQHLLVTVVCRTGRVVPGPAEGFWLMAWRYSNHLGDAHDGDVYLVTEHGWTGLVDQRAGFTPALPAAPRHLSLLTGPR